jgi:hypothetical protein
MSNIMQIAPADGAFLVRHIVFRTAFSNVIVLRKEIQEQNT